MESVASTAGPLPLWAGLIILLTTYAVSKLVLLSMGFRYVLFRDSFDLGKFLVDIGVWAAVYFTTMVLVSRWNARRAASR